MSRQNLRSFQDIQEFKIFQRYRQDIQDDERWEQELFTNVYAVKVLPWFSGNPKNAKKLVTGCDEKLVVPDCLKKNCDIQKEKNAFRTNFFNKLFGRKKSMIFAF